MTVTDIAPVDPAQIAEQVAILGDLSRLTPDQRMQYYAETCRSLGLNPLTRPFEYITLNGKLTLYATRGAGDQLRAVKGISITNLEPRQIGDLYVVVATGRDRTGREDSATGAVSVKGLQGEALANAMMKAETKAKRRMTLSLAGLGWPDESEVGSIPTAIPANVDAETGEIRRPTLAERARLAAEAAEAKGQVSSPAASAPQTAPEPEDEFEGTSAPVPDATAADKPICGDTRNDGVICNLAPDHAGPSHRRLAADGRSLTSWPVS